MKVPTAPLFPAIASALGLMAVYGFATQNSGSSETIRVDRVYESKSYGKIEFMGACSLTTETVSCWDADGAASPDLSERVKAYYIVQPEADIHLKFGRKNRMLVFKAPVRNYNSGETLSSTKTANGNYLNWAGQLGMNSLTADPQLIWYPVDVDPSEKTTSILFEMNSHLGTTAIPAKVGSEGTIDGFKVKIESIKPGPDRTITWVAAPNNRQKIWNVAVTFTGDNLANVPTCGISAIDAKGGQITRIDRNGDPLKPLPAGYFGGYSGPNGFDSGIVTVSGAGTTSQVWSVPINPAHIAHFNVTLSRTKTVRFENLLLDPK